MDTNLKTKSETLFLGLLLSSLFIMFPSPGKASFLDLQFSGNSYYQGHIIDGGNGSVTVSPLNNPDPCIRFVVGSGCLYIYAGGTVVTLAAAAFPGSIFTGWSGACSGTGTCTVITPANYNESVTVVATFLYFIPVSVSKSGTGSGTVTFGSSNTIGFICGATCSYNFDSPAFSFVATADSNSTFTGWSGPCSSYSGPICALDYFHAFEIPPVSVTANFTLNPTLTVFNTGTGSGIVTSNVGSSGYINCGSICSASPSFAYGTPSFTLTAVAYAGSVFKGWSGACSGTGTCTVILDNNKSVIANFERIGGCSGLTVDVSPSEVWPTIPPGGVPTGSFLGGTTRTSVLAKVSNPAPAGGCVVEFPAPTPVFGTGGHQHDGTRPAGSVSPSTCTIPEGATSCDTAPQYTSGEISGQEQIQATLKDTGENANATVTVRVSDINASMPESLEGVWRLTGKTPEHPNNHYSTAETAARVVAMATDYFDETDIAIRINDMSLEWGGMFDICGTFNIADTCIKAPNGGHHWHRVGKSVDVEHTGVQEKLLNRIAEKFQGSRYEVAQIHYEFP